MKNLFQIGTPAKETQVEKDKKDLLRKVEVFLRNEHAKDYYGVKDDMPDAFVEWLTKLDVNDWVELMGKFSSQSERGLDEEKIRCMISEFTGFDSVKDSLSQAICQA